MSRGILRTLAASLCFALLSAASVWAADIPFLSGRVVDNAQILKSATRERVLSLIHI